MTHHAPLRGIFTPNLVPLDPRDRINEPELRRYTEWLIGKGVHGLYPNGSTGEFLRFTPEERRRIVTVMAEQAAGRVPILAGAAEANARETIHACEYYHGLGVRAVAIVSPYYYRLSPAAVYAYFREIADHSPIDITLYNIPMFASPIDVPTVERLALECPRVVAIKDSSGDLPHMIRMIQRVRPHRPDFAFLTGWDAALMPMLLVGCDGGTNATSGIVPELTRRLYDLTIQGRLEDARALQYRLVTLFDAMIYSADFPEGFRAALQLRGFEPGAGRQPLSPEQRGDLEHISRTLACLLADEGFVDEPVGGCPPRAYVASADRATAASPNSATSDDVQVDRLVQGVLDELRRRGLA